jgi:hypothetical protein
MSTVLSGLSVPFPSRVRGAVPTWLREPLLHFLILGGVLFAVDHFILSRAGDPRVITIDAAVDQEAQRVFEASRGRKPDEEELYALRRVWLDNEVLYREGLAMQLDKGDKAIRERVIFKALSVINSGIKLPPFDDALLRNWFERNRTKYDEPTRFDFQEAVLAGDRSEAAMRGFVEALNAGTPADTQAGLRVFKNRPRANLEQSYGAAFVAALEAVPPGKWQVLPSREGWRAMRLESITPPRPADFENLRGIVLQDWTDTTLAKQRSAAVQALAKKYIVQVTASSQ